jgi:hypothetical protein
MMLDFRANPIPIFIGDILVKHFHIHDANALGESNAIPNLKLSFAESYDNGWIVVFIHCVLFMSSFIVAKAYRKAGSRSRTSVQYF